MKQDMIKKIFFVVCVMMIVSLLESPSFAAPKGTKEDPIVIELASVSRFNPVWDQWSRMIITMNKLMEDGGLQFDYKGGGVLARTETENVNGLKLGTIQAAVQATTIVENIVPDLGLIALPYLCEDDEKWLDFITNSPVIQKIKAKIEKNFNCVVVSFVYNSKLHIWNNTRPINSPADLKGLKIRVPDSPFYYRMFTLLGANPLAMDTPDTAIALQQGTLDGAIWNYHTANSMGMFDFFKYGSDTGLSAIVSLLLVRKDIFEGLPPEKQQLLLESAKKMVPLDYNEYIETEGKILEIVKEKGIDTNFNPDVEAFKKALAPMYLEYRQKIGEEIFDETMTYLGCDWWKE